jgi:hypothetical protein
VKADIAGKCRARTDASRGKKRFALFSFLRKLRIVGIENEGAFVR